MFTETWTEILSKFHIELKKAVVAKCVGDIFPATLMASGEIFLVSLGDFSILISTKKLGISVPKIHLIRSAIWENEEIERAPGSKHFALKIVELIGTFLL